jgi:hypothetical protein
LGALEEELGELDPPQPPTIKATTTAAPILKLRIPVWMGEVIG